MNQLRGLMMKLGELTIKLRDRIFHALTKRLVRLITSRRRVFEWQIRLSIERAVSPRDVEPQCQQKNCEGDGDPNDRPEKCGNTGGVGHVDCIVRHRRRQRRRKKKDGLQVEQSVKNALDRNHADDEHRDALRSPTAYCVEPERDHRAGYERERKIAPRRRGTRENRLKKTKYESEKQNQKRGSKQDYARRDRASNEDKQDRAKSHRAQIARAGNKHLRKRSTLRRVGFAAAIHRDAQTLHGIAGQKRGQRVPAFMYERDEDAEWITYY